MKVCLTANTAWNLANFRLSHMLHLQRMGIEVHAVAPADGYEQRLIEAGIHYHPWRIERSSLNPLQELKSVRNIHKIYKAIRPDLVHHYTVKALLYGTLAARLAGVPGIVNSVTGLPYIIISPKQGLRKRIARWVALKWYSWSVSGKRTHVIVQNSDDLEFLRSMNPKISEAVTVTNGSGVNLDHFEYSQLFDSSKPRILFVGRFLREKGIFELMAAIEGLRNEGLNFELNLCGAIDTGNLSSATQGDCDKWAGKGLVDSMQRVDDVRPMLRQSDLVVLPSYREGTPRSLLEATAIGRPIVTTDVPGCRNVVEDGINGRLVPAKSVPELQGALRELLLNTRLRRRMGRAGRRKAERMFDENQVIAQTEAVYRQLCPQQMQAHQSGPTKPIGLPGQFAIPRPYFPIDAATSPNRTGT